MLATLTPGLERPSFRNVLGPNITSEVARGILSDAINSALQSASVPQVGGAGTSPLADALHRLLAPNSAAQNQPPDAAAPEPDALRALLARFQESGYADIIRSWIANGPNQQIEPHQLNDALGRERVSQLAEQAGMSH